MDATQAAGHHLSSVRLVSPVNRALEWTGEKRIAAPDRCWVIVQSVSLLTFDQDFPWEIPPWRDQRRTMDKTFVEYIFSLLYIDGVLR